MTPVSHRPMLAGVLALLCAACGGAGADGHARTALLADSLFTAPATVRIPKSIRVIAGIGNGAGSGLGGIARFGPEQYQRLNPAMNTLGAAGVLRFADHSRRLLVHTQRGPNPCVPQPGIYSGCYRIDGDTRHYDYSHTVQVIPTAALGAEWRDDDAAEPVERTFGLPGVEFTPGWVVELGRRELLDVRQVRELEEGKLEVEYTWRWALTPTGYHFDEGGGGVSALAPAQRALVMDGFRADTVYTATATLVRNGDAWRATSLGVWHHD